MDKKFIVNLQGKDFITYEGLLNEAHNKGLISVETELIKYENNQCIMKATAKTEKGYFQGYGDADTTNVNKMIAKHLIRMAETRAKARALRDLTNIGMTALEELGGDDDVKPKKQKTQQQTTKNTKASTSTAQTGTQTPSQTDNNDIRCADCGEQVTPAVKAYCHKYLDRFKGKIVCQKHQANYK